MRGCLMLVAVLFVVFLFAGVCSTDSAGCPSTGEPGSAQHERDVQHCIEDGR